MARALEYVKRDFCGLCFVNLVDFDMIYGHRNNIDGYAEALTEFDKWLPEFMSEMRDEDILIITADHNIALASVYDSWGRQYAIVQPNSDNITIDTSAWGNNIYIIKVILDNSTTASFKLSRR